MKAAHLPLYLPFISKTKARKDRDPLRTSICFFLTVNSINTWLYSALRRFLFFKTITAKASVETANSESQIVVSVVSPVDTCDCGFDSVGLMLEG